MQHLYPLSKGDQLCPLGFHPQVRWPTRCKRCFRDYKEHGFKRCGDDMAISSPNLMDSSSSRTANAKSWTSTQNLSSENSGNSSDIELKKRPQSWTSTPDINDNVSKNVNVTVNLQIPPQRRHTTILDLNELENSISKPPRSPNIASKSGSLSPNIPSDLMILKTDSLAERARKMNIIKKMKSQNSRENSREKSISRQSSIEIENDKPPIKEPPRIVEPEVNHVQEKYSKVEKKSDPRIANAMQEFERLQAASKAAKEKNEISLKKSLKDEPRLPSRTSFSETSSLQDKINEMKVQIEELKNDKRTLALRLEQSKTTKSSEDLKQRLKAAEQLCEELMSENNSIKKELRGMETEIDEMHDAFHEEQGNECMKLRKELDQTNKNCRVLSFKLRKSEKKLEQMEQDKVLFNNNSEIQSKVRKLEEELKLANERVKQFEQESNSSKKKTPMLGLLGKSASADARITRESLTRGGSQEDPQKLLRDLKDASERESDLKEQLRFSEEESEMLKKKIARFEEENESLMLQVNKMATKTKSRKLSPIIRKRIADSTVDKDEGISDEEDPAELRILLDLNEQESSILRMKIDDLEKERKENKLQIMQLQKTINESNKPISTSKKTEKQINQLESEISTLKNSNLEKEKSISSLQSKLSMLENEVKANTSLKTDFDKVKDSLKVIEKEKDNLSKKLNAILNTKIENFPTHSPKVPTELTSKITLKKWVSEMEDEIQIFIGLLKSNIKQSNYEQENKKLLEKLKQLETDFKLKTDSSISKEKFKELEVENSKLSNEVSKLKSLSSSNEEKLKAQIAKVAKQEESRSSLELDNKNLKETLRTVRKELSQAKKDNVAFENKMSEIVNELSSVKQKLEDSKIEHEKQLKDIKKKTSAELEKSELLDSKNMIKKLQASLDKEQDLVNELERNLEHIKEENVLIKAQLSIQRENLESELNNYKQKYSNYNKINVEKSELNVKLINANKTIKELEMKILKSSSMEYERTRLKNSLNEKETEYKRLKQENEMNIDLVFQLRREVEDLNSKLSDFDRIHRARSSVNDHNNSLENEIRTLRRKLEAAELNTKSESAAIRLRYEQQVAKLNSENTSMQKQCERFKKDRDTFKQLLESAQKKIGDLKSSGTGRVSRNSIHSSDNDDDRNKIHYLEQQIGQLEDQLCDFRLETNKLKSELVSEKSSNAVKISEMQSKLNEYEEDRVLAGRTKIPGMKTKLELSWQKEREEQQRLLQETSTLARDLRQTLYEVEREREKERLEMKRKIDQLKNINDEEMEDGRKKIAELQCDLLDLRDAHAKIRTSNEKLRRERERYEKELVKRRIEIEGGDRKLNFLLHTLDEFIKCTPVLLSSISADSGKSKQEIDKQKQVDNSYISLIISRLNTASEDLRKHRRVNEEELEKNRLRKSTIRRAASQENDVNSKEGKTTSILKVSRNNGSIKKCLSLDQSMQNAQNIWKQDGSVSSIQSIGSDAVGFNSDCDSRLSGGSTQSDIPRCPRKKRKSLMGKLRSLSLSKNGRNSESDMSIQGSDSDVSLSNFSKRDLKGKLSGMFKRSSRSTSIDNIPNDRPVAVTVVGENNGNSNSSQRKTVRSQESSMYTKQRSKP